MEPQAFKMLPAMYWQVQMVEEAPSAPLGHPGRTQWFGMAAPAPPLAVQQLLGLRVLHRLDRFPFLEVPVRVASVALAGMVQVLGGHLAARVILGTR